jgi:hypothetical protein
VAALTVVEDLEVFEDRVGEFDPDLPLLAVSSSTCMRDQNDSMTALSKQSPIDPIESPRPESSARRVVGGHEILPGGGHVGARWWSRVLPGGGQGFCPR